MNEVERERTLLAMQLVELEKGELRYSPKRGGVGGHWKYARYTPETGMSWSEGRTAVDAVLRLRRSGS